MKRWNCILPKFIMKMNGVKYGRKLNLHGYPFIFRFPNAAIQIGNDVTINSNFWSNFAGLFQRTIIIARGGKICIGNHVGMSGVTIYARQGIYIEDDVTIGANTKIFDNDFHSLDSEEMMYLII